MRGHPDGVIVLARCGKTHRLFGVHFAETEPGLWLADGARAVGASARDKAHDSFEIHGRIGLADSYPGGPRCQGKALLKCGCGRIMCWAGEERDVSCPWCGRKGTVGEGLVGMLTAVDGLKLR